MTKYILVGGKERGSSKYGSHLAEEIYKTVAHPAKILSCFLADPDEWQWQQRARDWEAWFRKYFGDDITYSYTLPESLIEQVRSSDVVYLHGGDNDTLITRLRKYPELEGAFRGKVVIGSSAGANYLSTKFWTRRKGRVGDGGGVLPVNIMVHYGSQDVLFNDIPIDWKGAEAKLREAIGPDKELVHISEGEFVVVEA